MPVRQLLNAAGEVVNAIEINPDCVVLSAAEAAQVPIEHFQNGWFYVLADGLTIQDALPAENPEEGLDVPIAAEQ